MQVLDNVKPLSKKLLDTIPELKEGEVAVFRLKNAFTKESGREDPSCPEEVQLSGVQEIRDPYVDVAKGESQTKIVGTFIVDYKQLGNSGQAKPIYKPLTFRKGELRLDYTRQAEYIFAMRNKLCITNKYRKQMGAKASYPFEYELLSTKELITPFMQQKDMKYFAEKSIRDASFQQLREIAAMLNTSPDPRFHIKSYVQGSTLNSEAMKYELIQKAEQFAKQVLGANPSPEIKLRVNIYDAMVYGVLMFLDGRYQLDTDTTFVDLHSPEADVDKVDSLIKYFMSEEGREHYVLFAKTLKKALKVELN